MSRLWVRLPAALLIILGSVNVTFAQRTSPGQANSALDPEVLSAKAFLEEVLVRRYSLELSSKIDRGFFSLGSQLDLTLLPKKAPTNERMELEPISDLMIGTLDPEELIKRFAGHDERGLMAQSFLKNFRIRAVGVSVGLKEGLRPEVKAEVESWLSTRLKNEFGTVGKGEVTWIQAGEAKKLEEKPPATMWDSVDRFQALAGQIVLALALLFGIFLWKFLSGRPGLLSTQLGDGASIQVNAQGKGEKGEVAQEVQRKNMEEHDKINLLREVEEKRKRLNEIAPRLTVELQPIIRSWCQSGEEGKLKIACFAEAVGKELGKLPIPIDAMAEVTKTFGNMVALQLEQKRDLLEKIYWDLLTVLNLGSEALFKPFSYLGDQTVKSLNEVLMAENPKLKTLVALYLPTELRSNFIKSQTWEEKVRMVESAAALNAVEARELKSYDINVKGKITPQTTQQMIPLDLTLNKVVEGLTAVERISILHQITGPAIEAYKLSVPSIAFLGEWPEPKLSVFLARASSDEVLAYLRVRPELQEKFLKLAPPLTAEVVTDELNRPDQMSNAERTQILSFLDQKLDEMISKGELNLEDLFHKDANALIDELFGSAA